MLRVKLNPQYKNKNLSKHNFSRNCKFIALKTSLIKFKNRALISLIKCIRFLRIWTNKFSNWNRKTRWGGNTRNGVPHNFFHFVLGALQSGKWRDPKKLFYCVKVAQLPILKKFPFWYFTPSHKKADQFYSGNSRSHRSRSFLKSASS